MKSNARQPAPPDDLADEALLEWGRVVAEIGDRLEPIDRAIMTIYAETWATWREACRAANALPPSAYAETVPPCLQVMIDTGHLLRQLLTDLELTPAARISRDER